MEVPPPFNMPLQKRSEGGPRRPRSPDSRTTSARNCKRRCWRAQRCGAKQRAADKATLDALAEAVPNNIDALEARLQERLKALPALIEERVAAALKGSPGEPTKATSGAAANKSAWPAEAPLLSEPESSNPVGRQSSKVRFSSAEYSDDGSDSQAGSPAPSKGFSGRLTSQGSQPFELDSSTPAQTCPAPSPDNTRTRPRRILQSAKRGGLSA
eukprot:2276686-Prymnesium_polylepis.1